MNLSQATKKKIKKQGWYHQGGAVRPLYISYPVKACSFFTVFCKKIAVKYEVVLNVSNDFMDDYISTESSKKVALYYYHRQLKDQQFIVKLFTNWNKKLVPPYFKIIKEITAQDLSKLTDTALIKLFEKFNKAYLTVWYDSIFLDGFDYYGETILKEVLKKEGKNITVNNLDILLTPPNPSFIQQKRLKILALAEKTTKSKGISEFLLHNKYNKVTTKYPWLRKSLINLSSDFYWLNNDFASIEYLDSSHYYLELTDLLRSKDKLVDERKMRSSLKRLRNQKAQIFKKLKVSRNFINMIKALAILGNFRDYRKSYNQMAGSTLKKFVKELSDRTGFEEKGIENLFHWEIGLLFGNKKKFFNLINKRFSGCFYSLNSAEISSTIACGAEAKELNTFIKKIISSNKNLHGQTAFPGKVEGIVKIIRDKKDFYKMKKGNILVAPNTRPEFVPIMKLAGAVISDEGGMTCHSAIVSRELKIPCIVGMQGATIKLKDGDLVEVDANKGIVRKL